MAVIERVRRALASVSDYVSQTVGPVSQEFGNAFGCEPWAVTVRHGAAWLYVLRSSAASCSSCRSVFVVYLLPTSTLLGGFPGVPAPLPSFA
jgi:hypothetical protein